MQHQTQIIILYYSKIIKSILHINVNNAVDSYLMEKSKMFYEKQCSIFNQSNEI